MNISEIALVQSRLNQLVKGEVSHVVRQSDMLLITFGSTVTLRIQCYYRLMENGSILLARNDVYQPSEAMWQHWEGLGYEHDYIPEDFHSDEPGCNRLDECLERLNGDLSGLTVKAVMLNHLGDLTLCFTGGETLNVMIDTTGGEECWRLIDVTGEADDLVVYGDGAELVRPGDVDL